MSSPGTISVYVGPEKKFFTIEKELIARLIPFKRSFFIALRHWNLPEWTSESFTLVKHFLEHGDIPTLNHDGTQTSDSLAAHCFIYAQADSFIFEPLKNAIVDAVKEYLSATEGQYPSGLVKKVYRMTNPGDRFRKLIVDIFAWNIRVDAGRLLMR